MSFHISRLLSSLCYMLDRSLLFITHRNMKIKDIQIQFTIVYLGYLSSVILTVALGIGLYIIWISTRENVILAIAFLGLVVFVTSCALRYYFKFEGIGRALLHIWLGCILGVITFMEHELQKYESLQEVMNILLISSIFASWLWNLVERLLHLKKFEATIFSSTESLESLGFIIASLVTGVEAISITCLVIAFIFTLVSIRLKSVLGVLCLVVLSLITALTFFTNLPFTMNLYCLACFSGRHAFEPIIDLYFNNLSTLERWQAFFQKSKFIRHTVIICMFLVNLATGVIIGRLSANHKEWFVVVPIYIVFAIIWLCLHLVYFITTWKLMTKVTECNMTYNNISDERRSMNRIMASKGVRHFSLVSQRIICLSLASTIILAGIGWETRTTYSLSLILMVLPLECVTLSLFWELGDFLGGTCIGYALITPVLGKRTDNGLKLLSSNAVQEMGSRATATLNKMLHFFMVSMIENYGSDFSSSGLSLEYLESKTKQFFERKTADGPRYDTYLLYYCGDVYDSGDWALADNGNLKLDTLLDWWSQKNAQSGSRLILILDTLHSHVWTQDISYIKDEFVAIQTCKFTKTPDPEFGDSVQVGSFTNDWVHFNIDGEIKPAWSEKERIVRALYRVSKNWTDFTFYLPTPEDIEKHWDDNFPKLTKPLIKAVNFFRTGNLFCCFDCLFKCLKRKRMKWLSPKSFDTGHGFKLVRS
ncbi:hypothetical protein ACJMK2_016103 [Sinanodonta woodiana]|uniref:Transmembrane protein 168 n=2 Tax=Sinanodonta woodiana TaxID=1069815 RepID=A0ABD3UST0_SINWO